MLGVLKNLQILCKKKGFELIKFEFLFYFSDYIANISEVENFTVYIKTMVTFALFKINLFVFLFELYFPNSFFFFLIGEIFVIIRTFYVDIIQLMIHIVL